MKICKFRTARTPRAGQFVETLNTEGLEFPGSPLQGGFRRGLQNLERSVMEGLMVYRAPTYKWGVSSVEWRDDAKCNGKDPNLFELGEAGEKISDKDHELIAQGLKICATCPVRRQCKDESSELDRFWTTRGGQPPEGLFWDSREPKYLSPVQIHGTTTPPNKGVKMEPKKTCKWGHDNWRARENGRRDCITCRRLRNASLPLEGE